MHGAVAEGVVGGLQAQGEEGRAGRQGGKFLLQKGFVALLVNEP